ncbi:MAG: cytochrome-c peroxidase, partial [Verrucomicrobia bacterium]|nr:cytochrome-c peroxidase [Verrucomicrobiota bacterium]
PDQAGNKVTAEKVAKVIAAFERTLVAGDTPFDRFMRGDKSAMTVQQQKGMKTYEKAGCVHCHGGPMFSDFKLHFIDVTGTGRDDRQPMRTPTLRNLRYTAPYLHHGRKRTLQEVMVFYEKLMDAAAEVIDGGAETDPPFDPLLKHLHLEAEDFEDVLAFLDALNDEGWDKSVTKSVPSGLKVGGE